MHELRKEIGVLNQKNIELDIRVADLEAGKAQRNIRVADLEADRTLKSKQISDLQTHLGTITACYFDLKKKLAEELGDKFKSSVKEFKAGQPSQDPPVDPPAKRRTRVFNRFENEPVQAPNVVALKHAKLAASDKK